MTPYRLGVVVKEWGRARNELALLSGWFAERFAREQRLQGPQAYIEEMLEAPAASAEIMQAMAEAELSRMALSWGLEVEDLAPEREEG